MSERKTSQIITRVTEDDRAWVDQEADKQGLNTSTYIRMTLRRIRAASAAEHSTTSVERP
jgi:predicted DNA binding CopG/RHH family protein